MVIIIRIYTCACMNACSACICLYCIFATAYMRICAHMRILTKQAYPSMHFKKYKNTHTPAQLFSLVCHARHIQHKSTPQYLPLAPISQPDPHHQIP